jgi:hypothetical protein
VKKLIRGGVDYPNVLQVLSEKTRLKSLSVKEVVLMARELEEISVIEGLEALKFRYFRKLKIERRTAYANCCFKNISCLNSNYRITIDECTGISCVEDSERIVFCLISD